MNKTFLRRLYRLMKAANKAGNDYMKACFELDALCDTAYGFAPSDIDADEILDSVYCVGGMSDIDLMVTPERFDFIMQHAKEEDDQ